MKTPKTGREITKKWVEHILRDHKGVTDSPALLQVDNFTVREDLGDGFNSQVIFFNAETTEKNDASSPGVKQTYHLVAKLLINDPSSRVFNKKLKVFLKEYLIYTELIDTLNQILSTKAPQEPKITIPKLIYGKCTGKEDVLVMENLQYAGYEMNNKYNGLDGEQLKAAVDKIARIHAVSYVLLNTQDVVSKYECFPNIDEYLKTFLTMMKVIVSGCIEFLKSSSETEELGRKMELNKDSLLSNAFSSISVSSFKTLVHGDFWNNNFMLKYTDTPDGQKIIEEIQIIDWGNCSWGSPMYDLQYLVHTSTNRSVRNAHIDEILSQYHSTITRITTQLDCPVLNWDLTHLQAEWKRTYPLGFIMGCGLSIGTLSTTNYAQKKSEPSILDKPLLLPIKVLVDGMKLGMTKAFLPIAMSSKGEKFVIAMMKMFLKPIMEELKSGKNEAMNTRILDLIHEADENRLFST